MAYGSNNQPPADVKQLIDEHIGSAAQLEILLLLWEKRQMDWSADEVSRELRSAPELVDRSLTEMESAGLVDCTTRGATLPVPGKDAPGEARYRFPAEDVLLSQTLERLAKLYRERRYSVIDMIYARPPRAETATTPPPDSARAFSDAFRLRRDEDT